jgi:protein-S-isoprenylcysteine O-methyltransferase Ste14
MLGFRPAARFALECVRLRLVQGESLTGAFPRAGSGRAVLPRSCTSYGTGLVGLLGFVAGMWAATTHEMPTAVRVLVVVVGASLPMMLWGALVDRVGSRPTAGMAGPFDAQGDLARLFVKLLGLTATLGLLAFAYWLFPIYDQPFYRTFFDLAYLTLPWLGGLGVFYIYWLDARMAEPKDGAWHLGALLTGRHAEVDWQKLRPYLLSWIIKGYFLPLMVGWLGGNLDWIAGLGQTAPWTGIGSFLLSILSGLITLEPLRWAGHGLVALLQAMMAGEGAAFLSRFDVAVNVIFSLDLAFAALGYVLTLRALDGHIRSPEPTLLGWVVALICYPPYGDTTIGLYVDWSDGFEWRHWLEGMPALLVLWGGAILALETLFALATVHFGYRFSNLTHRGILTHGLYRLTKHPAYVTKCLSFWMLAVPFLPDQGWDGAARQALMMLGINWIYWMRARTEERHLSRDPDYVAYALWMEQHGIFRWIGRIIPALRYRPPLGSLPAGVTA